MEIRGLRAELGAALVGAPTPLAAADRLCTAYVELLDVDGASISLIKNAQTQGTFGSSNELSRELDGLQFTYGQGACLDAVAQNRPVVAEDLDSPAECRWPALTEAMLRYGIRAVFALPVTVASTPIGALDLYRTRSGPLHGDALTGGLWAAGLAALPLIDLMNADVDWRAAADSQDSWDQLASLERVEVYQATGMLLNAFGISAADAVAVLRTHAITTGSTASDVAFQIVNRTLVPVDGELRLADGDDKQ